MSFDPLAFKNQFPLFSHSDNKNLIYLDNAATTQKPHTVIEAISNFYSSINANAHRSSHRLARQTTELIETTRTATRNFLNAKYNEEVIFCRGATEALNLVAHGVTHTLSAGDEIILTTAEHHANLVPWQLQADTHNLSIKYLDSSNLGLNIQQLKNSLSEKTKVVSITGASNTLGFLNDLEAIKALLPPEVIFIVDAAQLAAHRMIDVQALDCDFLVFSSHKLYGPSGLGICYGKKTTLETLPPWQGGGEMVQQVKLNGTNFASTPHRFEAGTSSLAAIASFNACLDFWNMQERNQIERHEAELTQYLHTELNSMESIILNSTAENNVGITNFSIAPNKQLAAEDIAHLLDSQDIAIRAGHHCTQPLHAAMNIPHSIRVSVAAYNTQNDIERFLETLKNIIANTTPYKVSNNTQTKNFKTQHQQLKEISLEELESISGWQQRYKTIMQWSRYLISNKEIQLAENQVKGCESQTWMAHSNIEGKNYFLIDSESRIVKGLGAILLLLINGKPKKAISAVELEKKFQALGLEKHLSPSRSNGFKALVTAALDKI